MSNTQKKNVPELRFPGFEGEWEEKKLGEFCEFNNGINAKKEQYGMGRKFINVLDILNNNFITYENIIGKVSVPENVEKNNKVEFGDLVFLRSSETREDVGLCNVYLDKNYALYGGFIIRGKKVSDYNPIFLKEALNIPKKRYEIGSAAGGSTRFNVSQDILRKINVKFPPIEEQQKIGKFLSKLDRQIELEEQKLELLQQQKKGYMQKIFSQELRFKDENGEDHPDWEEKKLGDITEQSMYGIGASATRFDSKNIYIRITDIDEKSRKLNYQNLTTPDELNNKYKLKRNDILFARTGASTGKSYIHKEEKDIYNYYFAGFLIKFEINEQNSPLFIYQFTLTSKFNNWVKVMSVRSGQPGINSEEYAKLPLVLPDKLEQQKIAEFLDRFDRQIELEKQKIEILQQQKKGLLQSMFI
ncbi:restriction endonuclease subunit S [Staphylococcus schweitzeri]|uniref:Type I restriction modification DNA specificity domain protein n=1 Tax=Staphylococcus schweitzeri TaxID=1654388 RepID=A0A077UKB3_9STAP|nr:restriction endonuclease subunit S [Staphylococcus schweitzeri]CDR27488.1 type I restriction modification DNA specificity domain protein [Staphylococcus schweitzeri]